MPWTDDPREAFELRQEIRRCRTPTVSASVAISGTSTRHQRTPVRHHQLGRASRNSRGRGVTTTNHRFRVAPTSRTSSRSRSDYPTAVVKSSRTTAPPATSSTRQTPVGSQPHRKAGARLHRRWRRRERPARAKAVPRMRARRGGAAGLLETRSCTVRHQLSTLPFFTAPTRSRASFEDMFCAPACPTRRGRHALFLTARRSRRGWLTKAVVNPTTICRQQDQHARAAALVNVHQQDCT